MELGVVEGGASTIDHVCVAGVPTAIASEKQLVDAMVADAHAWRAGRLHRPAMVFETNCHVISLYAQDATFSSAIDSADIVHADGKFIVDLSRMLGSRRVPERTCTTDVIHAAARAAEEHSLSFFLLGGHDDVSAKCVERLKELYPRLRIAGRHHGYFRPEDQSAVVEQINASKADVVWVGLGKPEENYFCVANQDRLNCAWLMTCGGCFNYITGDYARAPSWMRSAGLEWLHRFFTGPTYLKQRYLLTMPHGIWLAFRWACFGGLKDAREIGNQSGASSVR